MVITQSVTTLLPFLLLSAVVKFTFVWFTLEPRARHGEPGRTAVPNSCSTVIAGNPSIKETDCGPRRQRLPLGPAVSRFTHLLPKLCWTATLSGVDRLIRHWTANAQLQPLRVDPDGSSLPPPPREPSIAQALVAVAVVPNYFIFWTIGSVT